MTEVLPGDQGLARAQGFASWEQSSAQALRTTRRYELSDSLRRFLGTKYLGDGAGIGLCDTGASPSEFQAAPGDRYREGAAPDRWTYESKRAVTACIAGLKVGILGLTLTLFAWLAPVGTARADSLLSQSGYVFGTQTADFSMTAPGPGTLDVNLVDYGFPSAFSSLTLSITSATGVLGGMSGPGTGFVNVGAAGTYYAHLVGTAQPLLNVGFYGLNIGFSAVAPVPLPASFWLVLAGIAATAWSLRRCKPRVSAGWESATAGPATVGSATGG